MLTNVHQTLSLYDRQHQKRSVLMAWTRRMLLAVAASAPFSAASASCDVTCEGLTFLGGPHVGQAVCGHEGCGTSAPFVGLESFGCSSNSHAWKGNCCNQDTCPNGGGDEHNAAKAHAGHTGAKCTDGREGECGDPQALQRRSNAVTAECCDQKSEDCSGGAGT
jgi:hypothetical protein